METAAESSSFSVGEAGVVTQNDCLMNIIIENQLARIAELEHRLEKMQKESSVLRGFLKNAKSGSSATKGVSTSGTRGAASPNVAAAATAQHSRPRNTESKSESKSESSLLSTKNSTAGPRPVIAKPAPAVRLPGPGKVSAGAASALQLQLLSSPVSMQNGSCPSEDGSPALSSSGKAASGDLAGTTRYWTKEEHQRYLIARAKFGEKDFVNISAFVGSRTPRQVRTHGEKFHKKLVREEARRLSAEAAITVEAQNNVRASSMLGVQSVVMPRVAPAESAAVPEKATVAKLDPAFLFVPKFDESEVETGDDCVVPEQEMVTDSKEEDLLLSGDAYLHSSYLSGMDDVLVPSTGMEWPELGHAFDSSF